MLTGRRSGPGQMKTLISDTTTQDGCSSSFRCRFTAAGISKASSSAAGLECVMGTTTTRLSPSSTSTVRTTTAGRSLRPSSTPLVVSPQVAIANDLRGPRRWNVHLRTFSRHRLLQQFGVVWRFYSCNRLSQPFGNLAGSINLPITTLQSRVLVSRQQHQVLSSVFRDGYWLHERPIGELAERFGDLTCGYLHDRTQFMHMLRKIRGIPKMRKYKFVVVWR